MWIRDQNLDLAGVNWLRLWVSASGGEGSIPGRGSKILHATWHGQKIKKKKKKRERVGFTFFSHIDTHVSVPCIEKIILSLQNWNNLLIGFLATSFAFSRVCSPGSNQGDFLKIVHCTIWFPCSKLSNSFLSHFK